MTFSSGKIQSTQTEGRELLKLCTLLFALIFVHKSLKRCSFAVSLRVCVICCAWSVEIRMKYTVFGICTNKIVLENTCGLASADSLYLQNIGRFDLKIEWTRIEQFHHEIKSSIFPICWLTVQCWRCSFCIFQYVFVVVFWKTYEFNEWTSSIAIQMETIMTYRSWLFYEFTLHLILIIFTIIMCQNGNK